MHVLALALVVAAILLAIAGIHVYWASGGRWGAAAAVPSRPDARPNPRPDVRGEGAALFAPGPVSTLAVAGAFVAATVLVLGRAGALPRVGPAWTYRYGMWALGAVFVLRAVGEFRYVGVFKRVRGTRFATLDTRVYTPLCAVLAAAVLYLAAA